MKPAPFSAAALLVASLGPGFAADRAPPLCPEQPTRLAVLGDSLADGLWGALYRGYLGCKTVTVLRAATVSDGLARTAPEDWLARLAEESGPDGMADIVVVQIGANDLTAIRAGSVRAVYGAPEWDAAYLDRARALSELLAASAGAVFWLGLPVAGPEDLETGYARISALQAAGVAEAGTAAAAKAEFVDIHGLTTFGTGGFTQNAEIDGTLEQLRAPDQVHFTELGYDLVMAAVQPGIERVMKARDADAALKTVALQ